MKEEKKRKFNGILDYNVIKGHKITGMTEEENEELIRSTSNFEKAHLRAYLKGYKQFIFHGRAFDVQEEWV